jgi:hypothetical protein
MLESVKVMSEILVDILLGVWEIACGGGGQQVAAKYLPPTAHVAFRGSGPPRPYPPKDTRGGPGGVLLMGGSDLPPSSPRGLGEVLGGVLHMGGQDPPKQPILASEG